MGKKFYNEIVRIYTYIDRGVMGLCALLVLGFASDKIWLGIICLVLTLASVLVEERITAVYTQKKLSEYEQDFIHDKSTVMNSFSDNNPLLLCLTNQSGEIHWRNELFDTAFDEDTCRSLFTAGYIKPFYDEPNKKRFLEHNGRTYRISAALVGGGSDKIMLFFENVSALQIVKKLYKDSRGCIAYINIDNFDELIESAGPEDQAKISAEVDRVLQDWAGGINAALTRLRSSRYVIFFEQQYLNRFRNTKFPVLSRIRDIETEADFPVTISIGVGAGAQDFASLQEDALEALELALGRGGDQAIIKYHGGATEFYGGALTTVEKRHKGKSRIVAHVLSQLMEASDNVIIIGHKRPDLDCYGAAIGVAAIARNEGVSAHIVIDTGYEAIDIIHETALASGEYSFVTQEEALELLGPKSLVVVVDAHIAAITEGPEIIKQAERIVVIDHHRKSTDAIDNTTLSHMESYASSTSELVTELMQYTGDKPSYTKFELEALLAGISVDTKNFSINTGARTFDAASWLRRNGADNNSVRSFFKMRLEFYQKKGNIISSAEILGNGIAVAYTKETDPGMQVLVAQAADELLDMKGVEAAFAAGCGSNATMVSARSLGKINVQTIMEQLGGGGHMNVAAAQVQESPEEAIAKIVAYLRETNML